MPLPVDVRGGAHVLPAYGSSPTPGGGWLSAKLCRLPQDRRRLLYHEGVGAPLGDSARGRSALHVDLAFGYGPALRRVAQCDGTPNRGPGSRASPSSVSTKDAS